MPYEKLPWYKIVKGKRQIQGPKARYPVVKFIDSDWGIKSTMGRQPGGPVRQLNALVDFIPPVRD
jgi:hypothetical protein